MNSKFFIVFLLSSALLLSGCNFFKNNQGNGDNNGENPEATPFQRDYEYDQQADDGTYQLNTANSTVRFSVDGTNGETYTGTIQLASGTAVVEEGQLQSSEFVLDMNTLTVEGGLTNIADYLKGSNYFDVQNNPQITGSINAVEEIPQSPNDLLNYEADAEFTIKGTTNDQDFDAAIIETSDNVINIIGEIDVEMDEYGNAAEANTVENDFEFNIELNYQPGE